MKRKIIFLLLNLALILCLCSCTFDLNFNVDDLFSTCEHEYTQEIISPTCENRGYTINTCSLCGNTKKTDYVKALGHTYTKVDTKATCTTDGYTTYKCSVCSHTYVSDKVDALGHTYIQQIVSSAAGKFINYSCSECEYKYSEEINVDSLLYGYTDLARYTNKSDLQGFYMKMLKVCESFHNSSADLATTALTVNGVETNYYVLSKFNYKDYNLTADEAVAIWKLIALDNPIFYWISNEVITGEKEIYVIVYEAYALYSARKAINTSIEQMTVSCAQGFSSTMTDKQKVKVIHDFIVKRIDYAYIAGSKTPTKEKWAYSIVGAAVNKQGVCEAYSETFAYLCISFGIDCLIVTGLGNSEEHAWNIVCIDNEWYGMDLTWDDYGNGNYGYDYYGMSYSEMRKLHIEDSFLELNINYMYKLPEISSKEL